MVNATALKKGTPPKRGSKADNPIKADPRPLDEKNRPLQLKIAPSVFEE